MPGRPGKCLLACATALVFAISGCGDEDEPERTIPPDAAAGMIDRLDAIETSAEGGRCDSVELNVDSLLLAINNLPAEVGIETKDALRDATANAEELALERCNPGEGNTGEGGAEETDTDSTTEPTTPPTTETAETATDETDTDADQPPAEDPSGSGSGGGGSGGGGSTGPGSGGGASGGGSTDGDTDVGGSGDVTAPSGGVSPESER
jgi:hypothetical protein